MKLLKSEERKGFTLVELMAVMLIIALLAGVAVKNIADAIERSRVNATKATLKIVHEAVDMFKIDTGLYSSEEIGLEELIIRPSDVKTWPKGGYLRSAEVPEDAWRNELIYMLDPDNDKPFVIVSLGADGREGGEEYDYDLYSTDAN